MTTNVILGDLLRFNARVFKTLEIPCHPNKLCLRNGQIFDAILPINPYIRKGGPVILVPADILRDLPIVTDWSEIASAASKNTELRNRVNLQIAQLWEVKSRKDKHELRRWALSDKRSFEAFLAMIRVTNASPYDIAGDPLGEVFWRKLAASLADEIPLKINRPPAMDLVGMSDVVEQIIDQFRFLIEDRRFSEDLYHDSVPRPEKAAQRLFFAVAHAYCKANDLDVTPEADTGNGPVDFKVSSGYRGRVLVEIKLSKNTKLVDGYIRNSLRHTKILRRPSKHFMLSLMLAKWVVKISD